MQVRFPWDVVMIFGGRDAQQSSSGSGASTVVADLRPTVIERYRHKLCWKCASCIVNYEQRIQVASSDTRLSNLRMSPTKVQPNEGLRLKLDESIGWIPEPRDPPILNVWQERALAEAATSAPDFEGSDGHYRPQKRGFVHNGRYYTGMAALRPVFIPPESFFVKQPQLWTQCTCERGCYRCVYDGATLCEPCKNECYDCEPGCCGNEEDASDSCDEGAISDEVPKTPVEYFNT